MTMPVTGPAARTAGVVGTARPRIEGQAKVTGAARYTADEPVPDVAFGAVVLSTVSRGRIRDIQVSAVLGMPGVLGVIDHTNAPRLNPQAGMFFGPDAGLQLLQDDTVVHAGRVIALVVAETIEEAQAAAAALPVTYDVQPHDTVFSAAHPRVRPASALFGGPVDVGDVDAELARSDAVVDQVYCTPEEYHSAMEPHAATAWWEEGRLQAVDSSQGTFLVARALAALFFLEAAQVRIRSEHVGGGFGAKGILGPQLILATMAATRFERPVRVTLTRRETFLTTSMRPATEQRVRLGADADGRLRAIHHHAFYEVSDIQQEYIENCTVLAKTLYRADAIRTAHTVVPLDILPPFSMRGPGSTPGSFALESAMDELAEQLHLDPVELRLRNEPAVGPVSGLPYSSRNLVSCLREGARRFGWAARNHRPQQRREGRLLVGTGCAAGAYAAGANPSTASVTAQPDGTFVVGVGAADIGTGARTALTAIAADALHVSPERIQLRIGDSDLGPAWTAGGSKGTESWALAVADAARKMRAAPHDGVLPVTVSVDTTQMLRELPVMERQSHSAVFAEVAVDPATGEVRVQRLLGMFAIGQVMNLLMARSQLIGGMIFGLSMALHEEGFRDSTSGRHVNADFASYHFAANADIQDIEADFVADDVTSDPLVFKGIGEIGTVSTAAAIANAVWHATGIRHRRLPIRLDQVIEDTPV
jgi:xanthine dehydrogenase YagR molybdenum-binding subunit